MDFNFQICPKGPVRVLLVHLASLGLILPVLGIISSLFVWSSELVHSITYSDSFNSWLSDTYYRITVPIKKEENSKSRLSVLIDVEPSERRTYQLVHDATFLITLDNFESSCLDLDKANLTVWKRSRPELILCSSSIDLERLWRIGITLQKRGYLKIAIAAE